MSTEHLDDRHECKEYSPSSLHGPKPSQMPIPGWHRSTSGFRTSSLAVLRLHRDCRHVGFGLGGVVERGLGAVQHDAPNAKTHETPISRFPSTSSPQMRKSCVLQTGPASLTMSTKIWCCEGLSKDGPGTATYSRPRRPRKNPSGPCGVDGAAWVLVA
jgi:hypothetical protein